MQILSPYQHASIKQMQVVLSIIGTLVACWIMYIQQGWINDDSVLYFEVARLFSLGEWQAGLRLFPWPLYSLLITAIDAATGFGIHLSAQILSAMLIFIAIYSLLNLVMLASGEKTTLLVATLLLLSTAYIFGDVVGMLLRDQGFWAFMLAALVFFIQFYRDGQLKHALYWQILAIIALLFRIETFSYMVLLPLILLGRTDMHYQQRLSLLAKAYVLNIAIAVLVILAVFLLGAIQLSDLGRIQEIFSAFSDIEHNVSSQLAKRVDIMAAQVLGQPLESYAWMSLVVSLVLITCIKSVLVAGWLPPILVAVNRKRMQQLMAPDVAKILWTTGLIVLMNGLLIIMKVNLLSSRYVILFGLIILVFASFSARSFVTQWQQKQLNLASRLGLMLAMIYVTITLGLNIWPKPEGYNYQKAATDYVKLLNKEDRKVFYVSPRARFYAGADYAGRGYDYWEFTQRAILDGSIYQYHYLVINLDVDENTPAREALLKEKLSDYTLIKTVYGFKKKKRMLIYEKIT